jgi:phosphorylase/glycogen(starch) synthase
MFGHAAGLVIERWWQERLADRREPAIAQFHEWMTGSGLLHLSSRVPSIGTVFTTHATMLGRALSSTGRSPEEGVDGKSPEELAESLGVRSKHSLEGVCARTSDVFTTVSEITAQEAKLFHHRDAEPLLPNGIDLAVIDELCGGVSRERARSALEDLVRRFCGEAATDAAFVCLSGRYEFHNKGIDVLLEALAQIDRTKGRRIVLFLMVPAGQSGLLPALQERMRVPPDSIATPLGISTHNLFDPDGDPVQQASRRLALDNHLGSRVKLLQIPIYLDRGDKLLDMPYEAVLRAMDLSCFPSFYEPWGYTPEESLAVGVPTITTDYAGFGRWARAEKLGPADGVHILERVGLSDHVTAERLAALIESIVATPVDRERQYRTCRRTAQRTAWSDLIQHYDVAFQSALQAASARDAQIVAPAFRPKISVPVAPAPEGTRPHLASFEVAATLPDALAGLERLARNFWWSWDPEGQSLFAELSPMSWEASHRNPIACLQQAPREDLDDRAADPKYTAKLARVLSRFDAYLARAKHEIDLGNGRAITRKNPIAYFCAEFGLHESLRIYSGGLGILAGDHLKSASDLDLPLIGIGLFYRLGYLRQRVNAAGDQIALDAENDPRKLPLELVRDEHGAPLEILLQLPSSLLVLRAWSVSVGRVTLYLLDSSVEANRPEDREITARLYGGDHEQRLRQEIVLGRGGARLLVKLGLEPAVFHINEGHAAFVTLERVARYVRKEGLTLDEARELVCATTAFTTHTPVPAGHDRFGEDLMRRYFSDAASWVGAPWDRFMACGQSEEDRSGFNMTYCALYFSDFANGVSKLHGEVSRELLAAFWPKLLKSELPVRSITNGVHLGTWTDPRIAELLGAKDRPPTGEDFARGAEKLDARKLWNQKRAAKRRLFDEVRVNVERAFVERHDRPLVLNEILSGLDERALVIGFARRFAPYKRAHLIFKDPARLAAILSSEERPVRLLIAGKAHPSDQLGKDILKRIVELSRTSELLGRVLFLDDYDMASAKSLVQGVDVWLNNPVRPLEASGTSGMKVAANGGLNLSVLDGWWCEGFDGANGWKIGNGQVYAQGELQDELDSAILYRLLEEEVVPMFFERDEAGLPRAWLERVRRNFATIPTQFNTDRMVGDYRDQAYLPLARSFFDLRSNGNARAKERARTAARLSREFGALKIRSVKISELAEMRVGDVVAVRAEVELGTLAPDDLLVELVLGQPKSGDLQNMALVRLAANPAPSEGNVWTFEGAHRVQRSGSYAYGVRVRARAQASESGRLQDLVLWA